VKSDARRIVSISTRLVIASSKRTCIIMQQIDTNVIDICATMQQIDTNVIETYTIHLSKEKIKRKTRKVRTITIRVCLN